jgi:hypothetical protein
MEKMVSGKYLTVVHDYGHRQPKCTRNRLSLELVLISCSFEPLVNSSWCCDLKSGGGERPESPVETTGRDNTLMYSN